MKMTKLFGMPLLLLAAGSVACTNNPTVNESSELSATGRALDASGSPLSGAKVRLLRYYHPLSIITPSVDALFSCSSSDWRVCGSAELNFELAFVRETTTDSEGRFRMDFLGADITAEQGLVDAMGNRESSFVVVVVFDPTDTTNKAGVYSYAATFSQGDRQFGAGDLQLWDSGATVDTVSAVATGQVLFTWNALSRSGQGSNIYRLEIGGTNSARLLINCTDDGLNNFNSCERLQGGQLAVRVSLFTLFAFYSDNGVFQAFVQGDGMNHRQRAKFVSPPTVTEVPRMEIAPGGIWAVAGPQNENLTNGPATDGNPTTQATLGLQADEVYVQIPTGTAISDAGLLNATLADVANACVIVEFSTDAFADINAAVASSAGNWTERGKFCGAGIDDNLSAIINFPTAQVAAWLRFRIERQGATATPYFRTIGEVAVYRPM